MAIVTTESGNYAAIAAAIRSKNGEETQYKPGEMAAAIEAIETGGGTNEPPELSDVNFIDYDGTLLFAYTFEEARALEALPEPPEHEGLVFDGWNWPLEQIKNATAPVIAGALYLTDDGATRIKIQLDYVLPEIMGLPFALKFTQSESGGVLVNWGDDPQRNESTDGTGIVELTHYYDAPGEYVISLKPVGSCEIAFGASDPDSQYDVYAGILGNYQMGNDLKYYQSSVVEVNIGKQFTKLYNYAFRYLARLERVSLPSGVGIGNAFNGCGALRGFVVPTADNTATLQIFYATSSQYTNMLSLVSLPYGLKAIEKQAFASRGNIRMLPIPQGVESIADQAFSSMPYPKKIIIPEGVKTIGMSAFSGSNPVEIDIPSTVTSIGNSCFSGSYSAMRVWVRATTPPTLGGSAALTGMDLAKIYVPAGSVDAYKAATNWSARASQIEAMPE